MSTQGPETDVHMADRLDAKGQAGPLSLARALGAEWGMFVADTITFGFAG